MAAYDMTLTPQTELDAVNQMLLSIGQAPVNTLTVTGIKDVSIARLVLHNVSREVQARGWRFNTDEKFPLAADANGKIAVPSDALKVDPWDQSRDYVERDDSGTRRLWDKKNHTFVIGETVYCDIIRFFSFAALPQAARAHIAHRAGRVFQAQVVGSKILYEFTKERELETLVELEREELQSGDLNMFHFDNDAGYIATRSFERY